jgi:hypothetical protein
MGETFTQRLQLVKNDNNELVNILEINAAFDKVDNNIVPAAKISRIASVSIQTGTTTEIDFTVINYDSWTTRVEGAMADLVNNKITAPIAGIYHLEAGICFNNNNVGYRALGISINSVVAPFKARNFMDANAGGIPTIIQVSDDVPLAAGDIIKCSVIQNSTAPLGIDSTGATADDAVFLSATWMGKIA